MWVWHFEYWFLSWIQIGSKNLKKKLSTFRTDLRWHWLEWLMSINAHYWVFTQIIIKHKLIFIFWFADCLTDHHYNFGNQSTWNNSLKCPCNKKLSCLHLITGESIEIVDIIYWNHETQNHCRCTVILNQNHSS